MMFTMDQLGKTLAAIFLATPTKSNMPIWWCQLAIALTLFVWVAVWNTRLGQWLWHKGITQLAWGLTLLAVFIGLQYQH